MGSHPGGQVLRQEPKVVTNGWAEGVHNEVKARGGALQLFGVKVGGCCCKIRYVVWIMLRKCSLYYQHFV